MKNIKFLMIALLMLAFIVPVRAITLPSVIKTEKQFLTQSVEKAVVCITVVSIPDFPDLLSVRMQLPIIIVGSNYFCSNYVDNCFLPLKRSTLIISKWKTPNIKKQYSPQKVC